MSSNASKIRFESGLGIYFDPQKFRFTYDADMFGPAMSESRRLDDIRPSLSEPNCAGPDPVYAIAMDVGRLTHAPELKRRMLLYGVVAYAAGKLGSEPVRSQGHVHTIAPHCGWSTPELVEIWAGRAIVYMQERVADIPGRCLAVEAGPGELVLIPPAWAHCIINADPEREMIFGAFCDRQYGFDYKNVRHRGGLAWFAHFGKDSKIEWSRNPSYAESNLSVRHARAYPEFQLETTSPIYEQFAQDPGRFQWISEPAIHAKLWETFEP